jgi:DNA-binding transcriptional regulator LsrR (DeoR family)
MALNNKQLKAIELLVYSPHMTQNVIADECGVHRDTIRRWREENEEFKTELRKAIRHRWEAAESLAVDTMISLAAEGNIQAAKYVLDSMDYGATQKIEANVKNDVVIRIGYEDE